MKLSKVKRKFDPVVKSLIERGRAENLPPDDEPIYQTKKVAASQTLRGASVSKRHNAPAISRGDRFTIRKSGEIFKIGTTVTRRYTRQIIAKLCDVEPSAVSYWLDNGILPQPYLTVEQGQGNKHYWLYHQIQPFASWYLHLKARGIHRISPKHHAAELKVLARQLKVAERKWLHYQGKEYLDEYTRYAGKYGVLWLE